MGFNIGYKYCVFCSNVLAGDVVVCPECQDYKGIMSVDDAESYLEMRIDPDDYVVLG